MERVSQLRTDKEYKENENSVNAESMSHVRTDEEYIETEKIKNLERISQLRTDEEYKKTEQSKQSKQKAKKDAEKKDKPSLYMHAHKHGDVALYRLSDFRTECSSCKALHF